MYMTIFLSISDCKKKSPVPVPTRVDEGRNGGSLLAMKMKTPTVVRGGEVSLLCDLGYKFTTIISRWREKKGEDEKWEEA